MASQTASKASPNLDPFIIDQDGPRNCSYLFDRTRCPYLLDRPLAGTVLLKSAQILGPMLATRPVSQRPILPRFEISSDFGAHLVKFEERFPAELDPITYDHYIRTTYGDRFNAAGLWLDWYVHESVSIQTYVW